MTKPLRTQFVIADGSRARWVVRSDHADDFVTVKELEAEGRPKGYPQGVAFESSAGQRFSVEEKDSAVREHRIRFAERVAETINTEAAQVVSQFEMRRR